ncbi:hypothetical protein BK133_00855 [Paenibacillus sp. FSL H8-0548]|uniref:hypothetical protein n=1 Tax=Paenibacillus sp. FSL H8-0548 TaxID=1920422 RepID=UPI00096BD40E|nr:hypothetical protein [Paenibacillus sp. FSL H8-0548]OMF38784.1 hypothetical protein BK133_00855 [Paenibacillus sp. FSL H8-0548]
MGLDTSHNAFHGAYSSFNRFRKVVAEAAGGSYPPHKDENMDKENWYWDSSYSKEANPGLYEFFNHSDCDGEISPEMCVKVADELEKLLPRIEELSKGTDGGGHIARDGGFVEVTKRFITGCRSAAGENEPLIFG